MKQLCADDLKTAAQKWILLGIPVLCIVGTIMHFVYDWSGKLPIVGIIAPVNESVWEHLKLAFWPILLWWIIGYLILGRCKTFSASQWFVSCSVAEIMSLLVIVSFYYTYTGAFGFESTILDIFSFFLGITVGQLVALHIYQCAKNSKIFFPYAISLLVLLAAAFIIFTFIPPDFPIFIDSSVGR